MAEDVPSTSSDVCTMKLQFCPRLFASVSTCLSVRLSRSLMHQPVHQLVVRLHLCLSAAAIKIDLNPPSLLINYLPSQPECKECSCRAPLPPPSDRGDGPISGCLTNWIFPVILVRDTTWRCNECGEPTELRDDLCDIFLMNQWAVWPVNCSSTLWRPIVVTTVGWEQKVKLP